MAGVPVYRDVEFGESGGSYRIAREWYFPMTRLTDEECLDLCVATKVAEGEHIPLLKSMSEVRDKLLSVLPAAQQDLIRDANELFEILSLGLADHAHCSRIMVDLQRALLTRKKVEVTYRSPHAKRSRKLKLSVRRLFLARSSWYAAAFDEAERKDKLFRLPRFQSVKVLAESAVVSPDWSLTEMLGRAWGVMKGERDEFVEIIFDAEAAELVAEHRWHETQRLLPQKDGRLIFRATVAGLSEIRWWVLGWGPHAVVTKPKALADEIQQLAARTLANYRPNKRKEGQP